MRPLSKQDSEIQQLLNRSVECSLQTRRKWMDSQMPRYADIQVGEDIYNLNTGKRLGKVSRLYRFQSDQHEGVLDASLEIRYEYEVAPFSFDNTSRQIGVRFGTLQQWHEETQRRLLITRL